MKYRVAGLIMESPMIYFFSGSANNIMENIKHQIQPSFVDLLLMEAMQLGVFFGPRTHKFYYFIKR